ncbi:hypothetical protein Vadar_027770 [Vaccinium darrowii]|uniref:Uncharacterized protein n=1 Tax=Vaccinium darrowii TaxID=229202 RepID=A0ACB7Y2L9_9ERIC|nr:hypothetical protein Vadar_027770 [Vaccinium darrowii]
MGDIAVDILLETLKQLITSSKLRLIIEEKNQLQSLEKEIKYLRVFLKDTEKKRNNYLEVMELCRKRDEDSCDRGEENYDENMYDINGVEVKQLKNSSTGSGGGSGSSRGSHTSKVAEEEVVLGFEEEVERLIEKLADGGEGRPLDIISIIGAGGGGKSTLARKVYNHPFTSYIFDIRAWINVSQDYDKTRKRELLICILEAIKPGNYENSSDDKLGEDLLKCLKGRKYLIVMDDIWGIEAWNDIQRSFPRECKGSKVLFTSRQLVQLDNVGYFPHYLAQLPNNCCWELLQKKDDNFLMKVYEGDSFPPSVANKHRRLFIGDQLFRKFSLRSRSQSRNLRSFLCTKSSVYNLSKPEVDAYLSFSEENFELLQVLSFICIPQSGYIGVRQLVHLRYLSFASFNNDITPFPYLLNLETLNLHLFGDIELPHDIFKMVKLRHLYTKHGIFTFHHSFEENGGNDFDHSSKLESLQTLQKICTCEACQSLVLRAPNLRKLGLNVGCRLKDNVFRFPDLERLNCPEKLSFKDTRVEHNSPRKSTLLPGLKLPITITRIIFEYTRLNWEELSLLQTLPSLEVLRLMRDACREPVWNTSELEGFPQLKYLKFYSLDIEDWIATEDQFLKLEVLVLEYCRKLERIPIAFGNLNELREIKLARCRSAEQSAREIQEEQRNRKGDDECLNLLAKGNFWP